MLTESETRMIDEALKGTAGKTEGVLDVLKAVQVSRGWVSDEALRDIADYLRTSAEDVEAIATFYPMIYRKPVGRHVIHYCDGVVCWVMGFEALVAKLTEVLGIRPGETSADGRFTLLPVSCIGHCEVAPAIIIDGDVHGLLEPGKIDEVLAGYE